MVQPTGKLSPKEERALRMSEKCWISCPKCFNSKKLYNSIGAEDHAKFHAGYFFCDKCGEITVRKKHKEKCNKGRGKKTLEEEEEEEEEWVDQWSVDAEFVKMLMNVPTY